MLTSRAVIMVAFLMVGLTPAQDRISFPTEDGGLVYANVYGRGKRGVVFARGARFNKESWDKQAQAVALVGFRALVFDFRGHGQSRGPAGRPPDQGRRFDVLAAVRYLRNSRATTVSVIGASMGGDYAAEAAEAEPDAIDRLVLLAAGAYTPLVRAKARKLFLMSRDDVIGDNKPRMPPIRDQYGKASGPKEFVVLEGSAHAQLLFQTDQGDRVMREILRFLSEP
jgi:pimeloyl-ACP methyl ester carboxylesterase